MGLQREPAALPRQRRKAGRSRLANARPATAAPKLNSLRKHPEFHGVASVTLEEQGFARLRSDSGPAAAELLAGRTLPPMGASPDDILITTAPLRSCLGAQQSSVPSQPL